jgi:glucoamylase
MEKNYRELFLEKFLNNFNNPEVYKGLIIASPSKSDPNYFYHWIRDAGVCMSTIFKLYEKKVLSKKEFTNYFTNYIHAERKIQNLNTLTYLGEPKINVDLTPYNEPWGRPQNDSPALRCISIMKYYNFILKNEEFDHIDNRFFYNKTLNKQSLIKSDLEYVSHNYFKPCFFACVYSELTRSIADIYNISND